VDQEGSNEAFTNHTLVLGNTALDINVVMLLKGASGGKSY
jgi:hypothetical protein